MKKKKFEFNSVLNPRAVVGAHIFKLLGVAFPAKWFNPKPEARPIPGTPEYRFGAIAELEDQLSRARTSARRRKLEGRIAAHRERLA